MSLDTPTPERSGREAFPSTRWNLVLAAGEGTKGLQPLDELCRVYWPPLYCFLRRKGHSPEDAEDLVQSFLTRIVRREDLAFVSPEKGRFRTFLLNSLRNYAIKQALHDKAQKRGGGQSAIPIDGEGAERLCGADLNEENPEQAFDRRWATTLLGRAMDKLRREQEARGKEAEFETLAPFLDGADPGEYEEVAVRLRMPRGSVAVAVHRLRLRLKALIEAEVAQTVSSADQIEDELAQLKEAWSK